MVGAGFLYNNKRRKGMSDLSSERGNVEIAPFCPVAPNGNMVGTRSPSYAGRMAIHAAKQDSQESQPTEHFSGEPEEE